MWESQEYVSINGGGGKLGKAYYTMMMFIIIELTFCFIYTLYL